MSEKHVLNLRREDGMWDLCPIHLTSHDIAFFAKKADAMALALGRGWYGRDVVKAFNRFNIFWIIWDHQGDQVRIATRSPGYVTFHSPLASVAEG